MSEGVESEEHLSTLGPEVLSGPLVKSDPESDIKLEPKKLEIAESSTIITSEKINEVPESLQKDQLSAEIKIESKVDSLTTILKHKLESEESPAIKRSKSVSSKPSLSPTPTPIPQTTTDPSLKTTTSDLLKQSGRTPDEIIDGCDLRKFLNKTLTPYLLSGLNEMTAKWEAGEFNNELYNDKKVLLIFSEVLKNLADKQ